MATVMAGSAALLVRAAARAGPTGSARAPAAAIAVATLASPILLLMTVPSTVNLVLRMSCLPLRSPDG